MIPGRAWIKNGYKPIMSARLIKRGKDKGRFEVTYQKYKEKKAIVLAKDIKTYPQED